MQQNPLRKVLDEMVAKERAKKKKKSLLTLRKEKRLSYYSGWGRGEQGKKIKSERQEKLQ